MSETLGPRQAHEALHEALVLVGCVLVDRSR